jgi:hypothetical protein
MGAAAPHDRNRSTTQLRSIPNRADLAADKYMHLPIFPTPGMSAIMHKWATQHTAHSIANAKLCVLVQRNKRR